MDNSYKIEARGQKLLVTSPYNTLFIEAARKLNAKWNAAQSAWEFNKLQRGIVEEKLADYFGDASVPGSLVDVKVMLGGGYFVELGGIEFFGRPVARAKDRDSGAKLVAGDDVVILSGTFTSGGSAKYWKTRASDAEIVFLNVPRKLVEAEAAKAMAYLEKQSNNGGCGTFAYEIMERAPEVEAEPTEITDDADFARLKLDRAEFAAVLAGLRLLQYVEEIPFGIDDILSDSNTFEPLSMDQIDDLCERINYGGAEW